MESSSLRKETVNLNRIHGRYCVFAVVVDALGQLEGKINNIPVVSLEVFECKIKKRIELLKKAISGGKGEIEIFEIGKKYNTGEL